MFFLDSQYRRCSVILSRFTHCWLMLFSVQKMEAELSAEREQLVADRMLAESELKTVNEDLSNKLSAAKSQVGKFVLNRACLLQT